MLEEEEEEEGIERKELMPLQQQGHKTVSRESNGARTMYLRYADTHEHLFPSFFLPRVTKVRKGS